MVTRGENERLTRVEGDAPMGRLIRDHYWLPFALSSHLVYEAGPLPVRLLGENYVAFRAEDGRIGFLDELCPHRRASLAARARRGQRRALHLPRLEDRRLGLRRRVPEPGRPPRAVRRQRPGRPLPGARGGRDRVGLAGRRRPAAVPRPAVSRTTRALSGACRMSRATGSRVSRAPSTPHTSGSSTRPGTARDRQAARARQPRPRPRPAARPTRPRRAPYGMRAAALRADRRRRHLRPRSPNTSCRS